MENVSFSDFIVWTSPAAFGLAIYLAHDAFTSVKDEIKTLRDKQNLISETVVEIKSSVNSAVETSRQTAIAVDNQTSVIRKIEARSENLDAFVKNVDRKITEHDENYGKVILILKKVISSLPKPPTKPQ